MKLTKSTLNATKNIMIERRIKTLVNEGFNKDQISEKLIEEGFGDFIRKGVDFAKKKTGLGMSAKSKEIKENIRSQYSVFMEYMNEEFPTGKELTRAITRAEQQGRSRTRGVGGFQQATFEDMPKKKRAVLMGQDRGVRQRIKQMEKFIQTETEKLDRKDKTYRKVLKFANALSEELEVMQSVLRNFRKQVRAAEKTGETEGAQALAQELQKAEQRRARAAKIAFAKQQDDIARDDREMRRKARNQKQPEDIIRGKSTERFGLGTRGSGG
jgi:hypothetical protein